jgi:hypothetical protein
VDLGAKEIHRVGAVMMDWGSQPPTHFSIFFSNATLPPFTFPLSAGNDVRNVTSGYVSISAPWDPVNAFEIKTYLGNQTNVTLETPVWSGRYAHLGIEGNQYGRDVRDGATVAEWNLIGEGFGVWAKKEEEIGEENMEL